jgi:serine protease
MQARAIGAAQLDELAVNARTLAVDPSRVASVIAQLRATRGVVSAEQAQYRHAMSTVSPDDPYYRGFGPGAPWFEDSTTPGQWDMHVMSLGTAWGEYNTLPVRGAPIAIIDTGVDVSHPEFAGGKVIRQHCYVTYPAGTSTSSGFAVDTDGHGTNVAGIADADTNNNFGFAGVAYDAPLLAYRIFPTTPSGGCEDNSSNPQCSTTDVDEANAINDAVAHGAKVINLSLGATGPLSNCTDTIEKNAVESAISKGVVVVAAAGNEGNGSLDCPAAYPGVIAVGAEGPGGAGDSTEIVASYSNYTSKTGGGSGGIYLVAPGGTAKDSSDSDDLHFVENVTSSEMSGASAYCRVDFAGKSGDCRGGFSGTSQATPHVTGVASLILGLHPGLTPAQVASAICSGAQDIGDAAKQGCGRVDAGAALTKAAAL